MSNKIFKLLVKLIDENNVEEIKEIIKNKEIDLSMRNNYLIMKAYYDFKKEIMFFLLNNEKVKKKMFIRDPLLYNYLQKRAIKNKIKKF